ncbi:DUF2793 domain-containing protein [Hyphomonas sp.]|uniref:DUF2793 domain-containing protein n=1 Tax=Hyphomonas sp. TaxID=87 RepID=UPI00352960F4
MDYSAQLGLPYLLPNQAQKHVTVNEALARLDIAVQTQALSASLTAQPSDPYEGDAYILPASASGVDWGGQAEGMIAAYQDGAWQFITPHEGWVAWVADSGHLLVRSAAGWVSLASAGGAPASFGINTSPEATNRLSVKSDAVRFSHDDVTPGTGDIRVYVNKATATDVASLVFQEGSSGRAEVGLSADGAFSIRTSPDGASFEDRFRIEPSGTGVVVGDPVHGAGAAIAVLGKMVLESSGVIQHRIVSRDWYQILQTDNYSSGANWHCTLHQSRRARGSDTSPAAVI